MLRGACARLALVLLTVSLAGPVFLIILLVPRWSDLLVHAGRIWSRSMLAAVGARVTYHGLQHVRGRSPVIFIANHQSMLDIWALLCMIPPATRFAAKQELFRIPVFGWLLRVSGCIPINRGSRAEAIRSLGIAAERIRGGCSVLLFPEGTRSRDGHLQPFKKGAFHLALQAAVPVVPVAITGSFDVMPPRTLRVRPGKVEVWIEPPIDVAPYQPADHERLMLDVHDAIRRRFEAAPAAPRSSVAGSATR